MSGVDALADRAVEEAAAQLAERLAAALPGATVTTGPDGVTVEGRGLARRALGDPALRWPAGLLK